MNLFHPVQQIDYMINLPVTIGGEVHAQTHYRSISEFYVNVVPPPYLFHHISQCDIIKIRSSLFPIQICLRIYFGQSVRSIRKILYALSGIHFDGFTPTSISDSYFPFDQSDAGIGRRIVTDVEFGTQYTNIYTSAFHNKRTDRKSTRLNSSHANISYAVFCLKK